jgi:hypothetical protein
MTPFRTTGRHLAGSLLFAQGVSMSVSRRPFVLGVATLVVAAVAAGSAQTATSTYATAGEFYLAYRQAFDKAKTVDELAPWMSKARRDEIAKETRDDREEMFELIKMFDDRTNIKILKQNKTATGAELHVEGVSADKSKSEGVVALVKEGTAWRIDRESWKGGWE